MRPRPQVDSYTLPNKATAKLRAKPVWTLFRWVLCQPTIPRRRHQMDPLSHRTNRRSPLKPPPGSWPSWPRKKTVPKLTNSTSAAGACCQKWRPHSRVAPQNVQSDIFESLRGPLRADGNPRHFYPVCGNRPPSIGITAPIRWTFRGILLRIHVVWRHAPCWKEAAGGAVGWVVDIEEEDRRWQMLLSESWRFS